MAEEPDVHQGLLKEDVAILLRTYSLEEVMQEVTEQRPAFEILMFARGHKSQCPCCGFKFKPGGK